MFADKGNPSMIEEVRQVFKTATPISFDLRKPIDRRDKGKGSKKKAAAAKYLPPLKRCNLIVFKNFVVFKYMGLEKVVVSHKWL